MDSDRLAYASILQLQQSIRSGAISLVEIARQQARRIEELNPTLNAFLSISADLEAQAERLEPAVAGEPEAYPLAGVVLSVKDLMPVTGLPTTAGSRVLAAKTAVHDAPAVARLRKAGCLIAGKTNLHEFAYGVTTENEHFGPTLNPWDPARIAGGSSGGSACALAAGLGHASIGTDTRGSIRIPAACCGVAGLKPTKGLVPTTDVIPLSVTLDHIGPMARSVDDVFALLAILADRNFDAPPLAGLRGGLADYYFEDLDAGVQECVEEAVRVLESLGLQWRELKIPELDAALEASGVIARAEAVAYHDQNLRERPELYGPGVRARLETGYQLTAGDLEEAQQTAARVRSHCEGAFQHVDVLLAPVIPTPPPLLGGPSATPSVATPAIVGSLVRLNAPQNVAGVPSLSLPGGFADGLPVGIQLVAAWNRESTLHTVGAAFQQATAWHQERPLLRAGRRAPRV